MKAAIFRRTGQPLEIAELDIDSPRGREVLIRTAAAGICHSDYHLMDGSRPPTSAHPVVLGHEAAGVIEAVGPDVTTVAPGDHVVTCISGFCGACEQCLGGHPNLCVAGVVSRSPGQPSRLGLSGEPAEQFFGIGAFAEYMLLHENSVAAVDADIPFDKAALMGCAVLSGLGAVFRTARVEPGATVAVFGCGGVGLSIIQGARLAGAAQIIAVDRVESKLVLARELGATDLIDAGEQDATAEIRAITGGKGAEHVLEAVGSIALIRQASESLSIRGTLTIVGVPPTGSIIEIPWSALRPECRVQTSRMGSNRFRFDIPRYLKLHQQGRLRLDEMVTGHIPLTEINEGFDAMVAGRAVRTMVTF